MSNADVNEQFFQEELKEAVATSYRQGIEDARMVALEQRCERTPWDAACMAIAEAIQALVPLTTEQPAERDTVPVAKNK